MADSDTRLGSALAAALPEWRRLLGEDRASADPETLAAASTATFTTTAAAIALLQPSTHEEVQQCVAIANRFRVPLYPISTGKNWGYGSRVPVRDAAVLDLSRLNRILDFNEELAYVTVEPGVTQRQLFEFLRARGSKLWMDATGSSADSSLIGNTLERGFGHTPMGDHCSHVCGFRVVMPTGESIDTGFARFSQGKCGPISRWGVGPSLDGLFSQSSLGVVTGMTVWLMPAPECFAAFVFQSDVPIGPIIDALRPLRMNGTLRSVMHIGNDYKVLSGTGQYPWGASAQTPLSADRMAMLRRELRIHHWSCSGGLYGTRQQVREAKRLLRVALGGKVVRLTFVDDRRLALLQRIEKPFRALTGRHDLHRALTLLPPLLRLLQGIPTDEFLPSTYWRKKAPVPATVNPEADRCGLLWCSPVAPNTGKDVTEVTQLAREIALEHGFEPLISVSLISERMTISTVALTYDRDVPGDDARAMACYESLTRQLLERGYPPYRVNVSSMDRARDGSHYGEVIDAIKGALDPNRILAPGRYE